VAINNNVKRKAKKQRNKDREKEGKGNGNFWELPFLKLLFFIISAPPGPFGPSKYCLEALYSPGSPAAVCRLPRHVGRRLCAPLFRVVCLFRAWEKYFSVAVYLPKASCNGYAIHFFMVGKAATRFSWLSLAFGFFAFLDFLSRSLIFPKRLVSLLKSRGESKNEHFCFGANEIVFMLRSFKRPKPSCESFRIPVIHGNLPTMAKNGPANGLCLTC